MLSGFGLTGSAIPLMGGQEASWRVGDAVVKPSDMQPAWLAWQAGLLTQLDGRDDFRVSVPLRAADGAWVVDGWTAWRYGDGSHIPRRWHDVIEVGRCLHAAVELEPEPPFLRERTDRWAIGDRVAWGDLPVPEWVVTAYVPVLAAALRPVDGRPQLIHGDLTGNVLFADDLPPLVIDLSPYWRPPTFATAIVVADALAFEGADASILEPLRDDPDIAQYLLRALIYRIVTDYVPRPGRPQAGTHDPYRFAVELGLELAGSG